MSYLQTHFVQFVNSCSAVVAVVVAVAVVAAQLVAVVVSVNKIYIKSIPNVYMVQTVILAKFLSIF